jgi:hypothetical protein
VTKCLKWTTPLLGLAYNFCLIQIVLKYIVYPREVLEAVI